MIFRTLPTLVLFCLSLSFQAQLAPGSIAPNFTATDINGTEHVLYDYLDQGYNVILEFSATWTGPAWDYHTSGPLNDLHNTYGPDGTQDFIVLMIESDENTTMDDLNGTGTDTMGDWVAETDFPIIDDAAISELFENAYFPTIYSICPDGITNEIGQVDLEAILAWDEAECCPGDFANDPALFETNFISQGCSSPEFEVILKNNGSSPLTSCTIELKENGTTVATQEWTGILETCESETITFDSVEVGASATMSAIITSPDDDASKNTFQSYSLWLQKWAHISVWSGLQIVGLKKTLLKFEIRLMKLLLKVLHLLKLRPPSMITICRLKIATR
ncbi:MAG: hypothetical protein HKN32_00160 [Flavobacteriales bacterium]|nr:hypothetical protein [Flavobacteriales bacterium]